MPTCSRLSGQQAEALREYRTAIAQKPEFGEVYWSMANLKVFRFEPEEVAAMEEQLKREDLSESAVVHFHFALGKAYEDAGDYDRAWAHYHSGNQRQRPLVSYDPVGFETRHEQIAEVFSREFLEAHAGEGFQSEAPIFIVGLPRSGSTLIEQILASHSQVEGTLELPILGDIAVSTGRYRRENREYPQSVRELAWPGLPRLRKAVPGGDTRLPVRPTGRASPTSCRTTSRTSASRT